ncbi:HEPN domain-containing protein [Pontiella agarivorans]|uniref:HEPN domain-containing protein n=1 Tax=Pontiella agarivorans TaxID=3038953 RepID=A0ABU5MVK9_9BACT|nr:HEPN domain-containing protein [Pontiella agarivorans]MDZ8118207.1 HEPN domain-containing protein [Pontiella agarivorans]
MKLNHTNLKLKHRESRWRLPEPTNLRIHRGLSWLQAAEATDDIDTRFILLWVSFNSIYARDFDVHETFGEKGRLNRYLGQLVKLDQSDLLFHVVWKNYSDKFCRFSMRVYGYIMSFY